MLRSELNDIETLVNEILWEAGTGGMNRNSEAPEKKLEAVETLCSVLKRKWTHELFSAIKEPVIKRYVQFHQAGIIQLSDQVRRMSPTLRSPADPIFPERDYGDRLNEILEKLLSFLRHQFYSYFDEDHRVSTYYCERLCQKISVQRSELEKYNKGKVAASLLKAYDASVQDFLDNAFLSGMTYRQAEQNLGLIILANQLLFNVPTTTTSSLIRAFYKQNLNTFHFANWYKDYWLTLIDAKNKRDVEILVSNELSDLKGIFVDPEKLAEPGLPSIDRVVIPFLEDLLQPARKPARSNGNYRFPLNLSVPQFAIFVRVFYKSGCFPITNVAKITRFFVQNFTTKKQTEISHKSFGHAFYSLDQVNAAAVRAYLQQMLSYVNETYFP